MLHDTDKKLFKEITETLLEERFYGFLIGNFEVSKKYKAQIDEESKKSTFIKDVIIFLIGTEGQEDLTGESLDGDCEGSDCENKGNKRDDDCAGDEGSTIGKKRIIQIVLFQQDFGNLFHVSHTTSL